MEMDVGNSDAKTTDEKDNSGPVFGTEVIRRTQTLPL